MQYPRKAKCSASSKKASRGRATESDLLIAKRPRDAPEARSRVSGIVPELAVIVSHGSSTSECSRQLSAATYSGDVIYRACRLPGRKRGILRAHCPLRPRAILERVSRSPPPSSSTVVPRVRALSNEFVISAAANKLAGTAARSFTRSAYRTVLRQFFHETPDARCIP